MKKEVTILEKILGTAFVSALTGWLVYLTIKAIIAIINLF